MSCEYCFNEFDCYERLPAKCSEGSWLCVECTKYIIDKKVQVYLNKVQKPAEVDQERLKLLSRFCKIHKQIHSICVTLTHLHIYCPKCEVYEDCLFYQGDFSSFEAEVDNLISQKLEFCSIVQQSSYIIPNNEKLIKNSIKEYEKYLELLIKAKKSQSLNMKTEVLSISSFSLMKDLYLSKAQKKLYRSIEEEFKPEPEPDQEIINLSNELSMQYQKICFIFMQKQISSWSAESRTYFIQQDLDDKIQIKSLGIAMNSLADFTVIEKFEIKCGKQSSVDEYKIIHNVSRSISQTYLLKSPITLNRNQSCSITISIDSSSLYTFHKPLNPQLSITGSNNSQTPSPILYLILD